MRKLLILLLMAATVFSLSACGGGSGSDPLGTDSLMFGHKEDPEGNNWLMAMQVDPVGTVVLTAKLKNASGNPVAGRDVYFAFVANTSGAKLNRAEAKTDAAGEATIIYTAGTIAGMDVVRASISNGASMDANIYVGSAGGSTGSQITLTSPTTTLLAGQNSILTATVTDSEGDPIVGQDVTFTLFSDNSGATLKALNGTATDKTDASGNVVAVYTAGASNPTQNVQDTIKASIVGASTAIILSRTGSGGGGGGGAAGGIKMSITAAPESLAAGQMKVIIATVLNADDTPIVGQAVNFGFVVNNSGAALTVVRANTDSTGAATALYTAGGNSSGLSIQDAVTASITDATGTYSAGTVITDRLPTVGTGNRIISFTEDPVTTVITPLPATSNVVILKVKVTTDNLLTPVLGETVTFSIIVGTGLLTDPNVGTVGATLPVITDTNGEAWVLFTRPGAGPGETVVRARIPGTTNGGDTAQIVYW